MKKILSLVLLCSSLVHAGEADHYTDRNEPLDDMAFVINAKANNYLNKAVADTNKSSSCDDSVDSEKVLYKELQKYFANHSKGQLVKDILYKDDVVKKTVPLVDSIYGEWSILNGFLLGRSAAKKSPLALTPMVRVGEQVVGVDKFEHMFGMGYKYFNKHYFKNKSMKKVLKFGVAREKTFLGGNFLATGVFAYGDLSANFNGMRFWNHVLLKRDDVLGKEYNLGPYVKCENKKWVVSSEKAIDFREYIDYSMDESVNCSKFATKSGLKKFKKSLKRLGDYKCPMDVSLLSVIKNKYSAKTSGDKKGKPLSHWILNDDGNEKVSYFNEF